LTVFCRNCRLGFSHISTQPLLLGCTHSTILMFTATAVLAINSFINRISHKHETKIQTQVNGKPVRECIGQCLHTRTHAQADGQVENIMPLVAHGMGGAGIKTLSNSTDSRTEQQQQ